VDARQRRRSKKTERRGVRRFTGAYVKGFCGFVVKEIADVFDLRKDLCA
jgi:hypothetical protein